VIPRLVLFLWITAALLAGFLWAPRVPALGDTTRVLYFHIPCAWITVLALAWSMVHSIGYLRTRRLSHDDHAAAAAELGVLFCIGAAVSGSLWARAKWGSFWNWDPRETTIFFLLLIYGAYLALRGAVEGEERRARLSAVYSAVAFVTVPFLIFVVPRLFATLHPSPILPQGGEGGGMDPRIQVCFGAMLLGFTALFFWILSLKVRLLHIERGAISESSAEAGTAS
jgi:heme exporter protein C